MDTRSRPSRSPRETRSRRCPRSSTRVRGMTMARRRFLKAAGAALGVVRTMRPASALAAPAELKVPESLPVDRFDFETKGLEGWTTVQGQWAVEEMAGAPSGAHVLTQRATRNEFNVIVAPSGPY